MSKLQKLFGFTFALSTIVAAHGEDLSQLPLLKNYSQERLSSYDRTGGNDDGGRKNPIKPGETR
ncbi:MAG: hypothetical protein ACRD7E_13895, partial [Bryobacteraceae bacterium]